MAGLAGEAAEFKRHDALVWRGLNDSSVFKVEDGADSTSIFKDERR